METKARYCIVFGCSNSNKHIPDLSFFSLPKDVERREEWLVAVGRKDLLTRTELKVKSYLVCATHFDESVIKVIKQLKPDAVPTRFLPSQSKKSFPRPSSDKQTQSEDFLSFDNTESNVDNDSSESQAAVPTLSIKCKQSSKLLDHPLVKTPQKRKALNDIQSKCKQTKQDANINNNAKVNKAVKGDGMEENTISRRLQQMVELGIKIENKFNHSDAEYKAFALNLHYSNPHIYRWFQPILKLPSKSEINSIEIKIPLKFDDHVLQGLSLKLKSLPPNAKYCTICIGTIPLKRNLYYNTKTDEVIGFHNINGNVSLQTANKACVIMLQSIYFNWNQPIAYAFLSNTKKNTSEFDGWVDEVVRKLVKIGFEVMALITDHKSNFNKYATLVKKITKDKPYFILDGRKIYYIFDVPHLVKSVRDKLLSGNFHYEGNLISWDHIKTLYEYEKEKEFRLIKKIKNSHVNPNKFEKRRLNCATQIFSHTVYAALETYIDFSKITDEARTTAKFIKTMNDVFDVLNSSNIKSANRKHAFRMSEKQLQVLEDGLNIFANIKTTNPNTEERDAKTNIFYNLQITIHSIQLLFKDLLTEGLEYIFTRRLNQENLEYFFRNIKQHVIVGSPRSELTPFKFSQAFSKLFLNRMLKISTPDDSELDINDTLVKIEDVSKNVTVNKSEETKPSLVALGGQIDYRIDLPDDNALMYVASYLLYKCSINHNCDTIIEVLKSAPCLEKTDFCHHQDYNKNASFYGHLKMPPKELIKCVEILETFFAKNFAKCIYNRPGSTIFAMLREIPLPDLPCTCFPIEYFLQLFVRLRIFATIKYNNCGFKTIKRSTKQYLKVKQLLL